MQKRLNLSPKNSDIFADPMCVFFTKKMDFLWDSLHLVPIAQSNFIFSLRNMCSLKGPPELNVYFELADTRNRSGTIGTL